MILWRPRSVESHDPGLLERWAERHLEGAVETMDVRGAAVLPLPEAARSARQAIIGAFIAGFVSSGIIAAYEVVMFPDGFALDPELVPDYLAYGTILLALTALEFWLLFRLGLWAAAKQVYAVTEALDPHTDREDRRPLIHALCRAVLEIEEPPLRPFDLDPAKYVRREHQLTLFIMYRLKVAASNFIAKIVVGRLLARIGLRGYAPFVAAPITGIWNFWVMRKVMNEVCYRLMGRLIVARLLGALSHVGEAEWRVAMMLVGNRITMFGEYSLNLDFLLISLNERVGDSISSPECLDDWDMLTKEFTALTPPAKSTMRTLAAYLFALKRPKLTALERRRLAELEISEVDVRKLERRVASLDMKLLDDLDALFEPIVAK